MELIARAASLRPLRSRPMIRPFSHYMEQCLYSSDGFYTSGRGSAGGRGGDFITSPEVGPLFGAVLARAIDRWWRDAGQPSSLPVVDLGAGPGGLLRALEVADPPCAAVWSLTSVDRSAGLDATAPDLDLRGAIVLANELLDNVPFDIGMRRTGVDHRLLIDGHPPDHAVSWEPLERSVGIEVADDLAFPILEGARSVVQHVLAQEPRRFVVFDYAADRTATLAERGGWLRTYRQHQRGEDPFVEPGQWDITTDVAIDQLPSADRVSTQADFLARHGIEVLVDEGRDHWKRHAAAPDLTAMRMRSRVREAEALLDPDGLGGFSCIEWIEPAPGRGRSGSD